VRDPIAYAECNTADTHALSNSDSDTNGHSYSDANSDGDRHSQSNAATTAHAAPTPESAALTEGVIL